MSAPERDPGGMGAKEPGAKMDAGKIMAGLLLDFGHALKAVAEVGTYGARDKYVRGGWLKVPDGHQRYTDAMLRHLLEEAIGEPHDKDSKLLHAAHLAWNALARLELELRAASDRSPHE